MFGFPAPMARWEGLLAGPHNAGALRIAGNPEEWATPVLCITGPAKCGLTFLGGAWASRFNGEALTPAQLAKAGRRGLDALAGRHVSVDDADLAAGKQDEALLSLINLVAAGGGRLLLTAHRPPSQWRTASADLKSRLNALPVGEIGPPDDNIVCARLAIAAERRFLRLSPETLNYLVPRLELAYEAVENFMDRLSDAVSDHDRAPSLPLARRVLEQISEAAGEDEAEG
jgi:chromosomal replication initiation ATPase DnaA